MTQNLPGDCRRCLGHELLEGLWARHSHDFWHALVWRTGPEAQFLREQEPQRVLARILDGQLNTQLANQLDKDSHAFFRDPAR